MDKSDSKDFSFIKQPFKEAKDENKKQEQQEVKETKEILSKTYDSVKNKTVSTQKIKKEIIHEIQVARKRTQEVFKKFGHFFKKGLNELNDSAREFQTEVFKSTKSSYQIASDPNDFKDTDFFLQDLKLDSALKDPQDTDNKDNIASKETLPKQSSYTSTSIQEPSNKPLKAQPFVCYDPEPIDLPKKVHSVLSDHNNSDYLSIPVLDQYKKDKDQASQERENNTLKSTIKQSSSRIRLIKKEPIVEQKQENIKEVINQETTKEEPYKKLLAYQRIDESRPRTIIYRSLNKSFVPKESQPKQQKEIQQTQKPEEKQESTVTQQNQTIQQTSKDISVKQELPTLLKAVKLPQEFQMVHDEQDEIQWLCEIKDILKENILEIQKQFIKNDDITASDQNLKKPNANVEIMNDVSRETDEIQSIELNFSSQKNASSTLLKKESILKNIQEKSKKPLDSSIMIPIISKEQDQHKPSPITSVANHDSNSISQLKSHSNPKDSSKDLLPQLPQTPSSYFYPYTVSSPLNQSMPIMPSLNVTNTAASTHAHQELKQPLTSQVALHNHQEQQQYKSDQHIEPMIESIKDIFNLQPAFILPPLHFLEASNGEHFEVDEVEIDKKVNNLLGKLKLFKIEGDIVNIHTGPVVTTFEYRPAAHIKVSRILNLSDDLAMALQAKTLRIEAPVPGKDVVGIEIPNNHCETILLRELLESKAFMESESPLTLALGKDIVGNPFVTDLRKLPHLLIAGTTGSGKSVGINAMILSLIYRNSPRELKFIMIDPKMLEFSIYNDIPHLLTPVITEPKKAITALSATVSEMEKRYAAMSIAQTKNIENYNQKMRAEGGQTLPYIVVVIDELADLMMTGGKEVEFHIMRLAQMARASGIHLIIATQRPSVDIVTGSIKTNLPSRISYKVGQKIDSKVILDSFGAETLLGKGDMLFMSSDGSGIKRLHAPWSSEDEIVKIVEFLKAQSLPEYDEEFLKNTEPQNTKNSSLEGDDLYTQAKQIILNDKKTSASYIQRRLSIGYNRAANIIEELEREGFLSAPNSKGVREILG